MSSPSSWRPRHSFMLKAALAAGLVVLADVLFYDHDAGSTVGLFALVLLAAALIVHRLSLRDRRATLAILLALSFGLVQIDRPTLLGLVLFILSTGVAILSGRAGPSDAWRWFQRLGFNAIAAPLRPPSDLAKLRKLSPLRALHVPSALSMLVLPVGGGAIFLWLFALANPVLEEGLGQFFSFEAELDIFRAVFWLIVLTIVWGVMRPRLLRRPAPTPGAEGDLKLPGVTVASVGLALAVFNLVFALQNGLDLAFLWSGASLPDGMTLAQYAHRGAYPLIATALIAGLFVLVVLAPGSATSRNRMVRGLVVLWVAQNVFLVASTMLRTIDYVEVYSLTRLRIAALAWMVLVAVGLMLICWRMLRAKSSSWLINANVLAAGIVLAACSVVDLGAIAAHWNVRHASEAGGKGANLDLCYLSDLGDAALVPLAHLEQQRLTPEFGDRVTWLRRNLLTAAEQKQANWHSWTWRRARRVGEAKALLAHGQVYAPLVQGSRQCDGTAVPPPAEPATVWPQQPTLVDPQPPLTSSQPR